MRSKDIHIGRTYNCVCQEMGSSVRAVIKYKDPPLCEDEPPTYTVNCKRKSCPHGIPTECVMYAREIRSVATDVNTLGNFPKKSKEV